MCCVDRLRSQPLAACQLTGHFCWKLSLSVDRIEPCLSDQIPGLLKKSEVYSTGRTDYVTHIVYSQSG